MHENVILILRAFFFASSSSSFSYFSSSPSSACRVVLPPPNLTQAAAHLANTGGTASSARKEQRLRYTCLAFFGECRSAEVDGEHGREAAVPPPSGRSTSTVAAATTRATQSLSSRPVAEGVRSRLHERAGFVAVLTLLLQPIEEWARCKRFVLASEHFSSLSRFCRHERFIPRVPYPPSPPMLFTRHTGRPLKTQDSHKVALPFSNTSSRPLRRMYASKLNRLS